MGTVDQRLISHIAEWRKRQSIAVHRWDLLEQRLLAIKRSFEFLRDHMEPKHPARVELLRHVPVALVATIQGYFSVLIRDLVDFGPPFSDNACKFADIRATMEVLVLIKEHKMTIGELLCNSLSFSRIESIHSAMSCLIGQDFPLLLKKLELKCPGCRRTFTLERNVGEVLRSMAQLFQLRNIYCHELAQGPPPAVLEMEGLLNHAQFHLVLSEMVIAPLLSERLEVRAKIKRTKTVPQAEVRRRAKRGKAARDALLDSGTSPDGRTHSGCA